MDGSNVVPGLAIVRLLVGTPGEGLHQEWTSPLSLPLTNFRLVRHKLVSIMQSVTGTDTGDVHQCLLQIGCRHDWRHVRTHALVEGS